MARPKKTPDVIEQHTDDGIESHPMIDPSLVPDDGSPPVIAKPKEPEPVTPAPGKWLLGQQANGKPVAVQLDRCGAFSVNEYGQLCVYCGSTLFLKKGWSEGTLSQALRHVGAGR